MKKPELPTQEEMKVAAEELKEQVKAGLPQSEEIKNITNDFKEQVKSEWDQAAEVSQQMKKEINRKEPLSVVLKKMFSITADAASHEEIQNRLISGGAVTGTNMIVMICAIFIASIGLITDSIAVIIGAMLISPLMGSILAMSYGTVSNDPKTAGRHMVGFFFQILVSVAVATLFFLICPQKEATEQILARTSPGIFDVLIAIAGGVAGIVGQTRADKANNIIPGVAIATALMPPLCTCGFCIANARWVMLGKAAYLFIINAYFIFMSACVILAALRIPKVKEFSEKEWKRMRYKMIRNTIIVLIPIIAIAIIMNNQ